MKNHSPGCICRHCERNAKKVAPKPPVAADWIVHSWSKVACSFAAKYGAPVWLVGSALLVEHPADIDIRVPMQEHDLQRLFGDKGGERDQKGHYTQREYLIWRESLKQSRRWDRQCGGGRRVDFQIQTASVFDTHAGPRVRLDCLPDEFFLAGMGDP